MTTAQLLYKLREMARNRYIQGWTMRELQNDLEEVLLAVFNYNTNQDRMLEDEKKPNET